MTRLLSLVGVCCLLVIVFLTRSRAQDRPQTATVRIVALIWNGSYLTGPHVKSFESEAGAEIRDQFRSGIASNVPFGIYDLVIDEPGFLPMRRRVDVVEPDVWVVVSLDLGPGDTIGYAPNFTVRGTIKNFSPNDEPIYLRLVSVYTDYIGDTKLTTSGTQGTFTLSGEEPSGRYVLITTGRRGVLNTRSVDILNAPLAPIEIDLANPKGVQSGRGR